MKTKSIRTNKRGRLRISAKTSEKWFERMNSTQTSEETEVTNTERETEERIPTRCSHVVRMVEHIRRRYVLRYNTVTECTEYMERDGNGTFLMLDMRALKRITLEVQLAGIAVGFNDVRNYVGSDFIGCFDPIGDFLAKCVGRWDGSDHIGRLADTVPTEDPEWRERFHTWFLGMVAQWTGKTGELYGNSNVPLLISDQGFNKSTFCRRLLPPELKWGYCDSLQLAEKKQVLRAMSELLLINLDEFNQISPKLQEGFLKNVVQLPAVKMKRPWGTAIEELPRRASFIATSNMQNVLSDPSGSRRFICVDFNRPIDVATPIDYTQLYAQALSEIESGRRWYFDKLETELLTMSNDRFQRTMAAEDFFKEYFRIGKENGRGEYMTTVAIFQHLRQKAGAAAMASTNLTTLSRRLKALPGMTSRRTWRGNEFLVELVYE